MSFRDRTLFAGVDIGGTTTQVVVCAEDLTVLDRAEVATPSADGGRAMIGAALGALAPLLEGTPADSPVAGSARPAWWTPPPAASWWPATPSPAGPVSR